MSAQFGDYASRSYAYRLAARIYGPNADTWLDLARLGLGDTPDKPTTPRALLNSGCHACIATVVQALEKQEKQ